MQPEFPTEPRDPEVSDASSPAASGPADSDGGKRRSRRRRWIGGWLRDLAVFGMIYMTVTTFVARAYVVPTGSMEPTIHGDQSSLVADRLFVEKVSKHFTDFDIGDILVFDPPKGVSESDIPYIKRLVAKGGDEIDIHDGLIYIDGKPQPFLEHLGRTYVQLAEQKIHFPFHVPEGHYFMMGDNSTVSQDSRFFGPVPRESIIGRVIFRIWPLNRLGTVE